MMDDQLLAHLQAMVKMLWESLLADLKADLLVVHLVD
jgi:hypothetical protein